MFKVRWEIWHDSYCKFTAESHNEEILESANISQSYERISSGTFLWLTVYPMDMYRLFRHCQRGNLQTAAHSL